MEDLIIKAILSQDDLVHLTESELKAEFNKAVIQQDNVRKNEEFDFLEKRKEKIAICLFFRSKQIQGKHLTLFINDEIKQYDSEVNNEKKYPPAFYEHVLNYEKFYWGIPTRISNIIKSVDCKTIAEFLDYLTKDAKKYNRSKVTSFFHIRNAGRQSLSEFNELLARYEWEILT